MRHEVAGFPDKYARWPGIAGCATKMLTGRACASTIRVTSADVVRALRTLHSFAMVGLTEQWHVSVCVFHALLMNRSIPDMQELRITHAGHYATTTSAPEVLRVYDESLLKGFKDVNDEHVYDAATTRFWADARKTGCAHMRR